MSKLKELYELAVVDDVLLCTYVKGSKMELKGGDAATIETDNEISENRAAGGKIFYDLEELKKSLEKEKKFECTVLPTRVAVGSPYPVIRIG